MAMTGGIDWGISEPFSRRNPREIGEGLHRGYLRKVGYDPRSMSILIDDYRNGYRFASDIQSAVEMLQGGQIYPFPEPKKKQKQKCKSCSGSSCEGKALDWRGRCSATIDKEAVSRRKVYWNRYSKNKSKSAVI